MMDLEGIVVLDLTRLLPGAVATQYLADWGAEVIKIEQPGAGDYARTMSASVFKRTNAGKKSIVLNLKNPRGREILKSLAGAADEQKPYVVKDGKVDQHTYNGWRRYTESCLRCHGPDGAGSSYAPDLTDSLKHMSEDEFKDIVINGRKNVNTAAENVMPAFGEAEDVVTYLDDIYAYLKARSDGVLGRGRPERFEQK